jgi:hypothetical protein
MTTAHYENHDLEYVCFDMRPSVKRRGKMPIVIVSSGSPFRERAALRILEPAEKQKLMIASNAPPTKAPTTSLQWHHGH